MTNELDGPLIRELLEELAFRLSEADVKATVYVVGGAAMALEFDNRRVTADVDAIFSPHASVAEIAVEIAAQRNLPPDWLNSSARPWIPGGERGTILFDRPGLAVTVASAEHLLAMKMAASRPQDLRDLRVLFAQLNVTQPEQAADMAERIYGPDSSQLTPREDLLLIAREVLHRPDLDPAGPGLDR